MDELIKELQALVDKYSAEDAPEPTEEDAERMAQLTDEINKRSAAQDDMQKRTAAAKAAIESGTAKPLEAAPVAKREDHMIRDTTDYKAAERHGYFKRLATESGVRLIGGNELNDAEKRAMEMRASMLTTTNASVVPVEVAKEILAIIDGGTVLFADAHRSNMPHQFEVPRHKSIKAGDAGVTKEGEAPTDEENEWDRLKFTGTELKKTVRMSRQMLVQSLDGFEDYIIGEVGSRLSVAADNYIIANPLAGAIAQTTTALSKKALLTAFGALKKYSLATPKGIVVYANNSTIWNQIAAVENGNKDSYFYEEKTEDPAIQGRIFGKIIKEDDNIPDNVIYVGFPDLIRGNVFSGPDVTPYVATDGTQQHCFDGYLLYDAGLAADTAFVKLTIGA